MGSWSVSIMGGDGPLDIQCEYEELFGALDPDPEDEDPVPFRVPTAAEAVALIRDLGILEPETAYVVGFLQMERAGPMSDELRRLVLEGLDADMENTSDWDKPEEREASLNQFRKMVVEYPAEGAEVEMPYQAGLLETICEKLGGQ